MSLEKFYYNLLHISPKVLSEKDRFVLIEQTIQHQMEMIKDVSSTIEGLCKVASYNIGEALKQHDFGIQYINTKDYSCDYEHVAILVYYEVEHTINYVLVDSTFPQFIPIENMQVTPSLKEWPGRILEHRNLKLYQDLCTKGYAKIEPKDFEDYLKSFSSTYDFDGTLFDIVLNDHKKK